MSHCVEVSTKAGFRDARGESLRQQVEALGVGGVQTLSVTDLYFLQGEIDAGQVESLTAMLHDPVVEQAAWRRLDAVETVELPPGAWSVEVALLPGVTDSVAESLLQGASMIGVTGLQQAATGHRYLLTGDLDEPSVRRIASSLLANDVIQAYHLNELAAPPFVGNLSPGPSPERGGESDSLPLGGGGQGRGLDSHLAEAISLTPATSHELSAISQGRGLDSHLAETISLTPATSHELSAISQGRRLSLDLAEMQAIQAYYRQEGREPTDVELEMLAQTWSEHCVHKTFKAVIEYVGPEDNTTNGGTANGGTADGRIADGGTANGGTTDGRMADGGTANGGTADGRMADEEAVGPAIGGTWHSAEQPLIIDGLLKTYIRAATERVAKPWVRSAFVDNAGIVAFDEQYDLAFKVETHNHPSALEPFGGANTGVGGVVRDVIGVSARPIANTDVLCFGPEDLPFDELPAGVLHPRRIAAGVTAGIEDYGNKMGIPTVNGAILYDPGYTANPLVFCGCLGILPHGSHRTNPQTGDLCVVIGGRTGRDGLRGATFSSMEMDHATSEIAGSAVQIGHPIHEKQVLEAILLARDEELYSAITDCGAGGLSSAVGEMGKELGAEVHLERVPLKYPGLRPWEIWLSEAQERMVLAVPPAKWPRLQAICDGLDVEATALGAFTGDGRLRIYYAEHLVGDLAAEFLHDGIPRRSLRAEWASPSPPSPLPPPQRGRAGEGVKTSLTSALLSLLSAPETRSKEDVVRQYDHEVQGGTVVKPFVGQANAGPGDAAVLAPLDAVRGTVNSEQWTVNREPIRGVALAVGANPFYTAIDPYLMAWAAIDEAMRNVVAVGADPDQVSLLDNFSWGNPNLPDRLGSLVRCTQGCYDAAVAFGAPFISGKDSLNNEYTGADGKKHAIPGTLVVSALGIVPDVRGAVTMDLKAAGNLLYVVGLTRGEMGGSSYERNVQGMSEYNPSPGPPTPASGLRGAAQSPKRRGESEDSLPLEEELRSAGSGLAPQPPDSPLATYQRLHRAIAGGLVQACHDCSEGGLALAAAEMALAGGLGLALRLADVPSSGDAYDDTAIAFCESLGRLLVEIAPQDAPAFEAALAGSVTAHIGEVSSDRRVIIAGLDGSVVIDIDLAAIEHAWRGHLNARASS